MKENPAQQFRYSVLIRTFNCQGTLSATLESLAKQTNPPSEYVVIDSGSTDGTLRLFPPGSLIHQFIGPAFSYSGALNQGIAHVSTEYVLIMSSHTVLENADAVESALTLLASSETVGAAYFCSDNSGTLTYRSIDASNFDGFNGLWNTCSVIKMSLLKQRDFRLDVFAAEDQEWARWLFAERQMTVARYTGAGLINNNPRASSSRKRANEYVAIAYFVNRQLLKWRNLARIGYGVIRPKRHIRIRDRWFNLVLLSRLLACQCFKPRAQSRYL